MRLDPVVVGIVVLTTAFTAFLSHRALAVFHDGVRPILKEFIDGRMTRAAMAAVAFGLSAGFIFGYGVPLSLSTGLLNPWLLFLPTDILGIAAPSVWLAPVLGGAWGAAVAVGLQGLLNAAKSLPVDFLTALQQFSNPVIFLFSLFPVLAITLQFGRQKGLLSFAVVVVVRVLLARFTKLFPEAFTMAVGIVLLLIFAVLKDMGERRKQAGDGEVRANAAETESFFYENAQRLRRNMFWLAGAGALIAVLANLHVFAGSEVSIFPLKAGNVSAAAQGDFYRALGFLPLIATTSLASGAYQIVGLTFVYPIGYLMPNPLLAAVAGYAVYLAEILALQAIGRGLAAFPSIQDASDHIRAAITTMIEYALFFGALLAGNQMAPGGLGVVLVGGLYAINEALGRPVIRLAAGPTAAILTGVLLNVLYFLHLFAPAAK